jgi:uncharacterized protein
MKKDLMDILACPVCKAYPLVLKITNEEALNIIEGELTCPGCGRTYPIEDSIPNMLRPEDR